MLEGEDNIRRVEFCSILLKATNLAQIEEKFAAGAVLQAEVQLALCLESVVHLDDEFMIHAFLFN